MTKYNPTLKAELINSYLQGNWSFNDLSRKYDVPAKQICLWVKRYQLSGTDSLIRREGKRSFTAEFKLSVIDYYQTHDESTTEVAAKYDILPSQVSIWRTSFNRDGIESLKPHRKGRKSMKKQSKKQVRNLANMSEIDRLREELAQRNKELYETKLERDILKKSMTLFGPSKDVKKHR